jgi:hypothetical protein
MTGTPGLGALATHALDCGLLVYADDDEERDRGRFADQSERGGENKSVHPGDIVGIRI